MGDGARRAQMENRFGLGQPVDTYGEPCPHVKQTILTDGKETVDDQSNEVISDAQSIIFWKQAIDEAIQDGNLKALVKFADDLGKLKRYYDNGELNVVQKNKSVGGKNIRVAILPHLTKIMMAGEGPTQVKVIDPGTGKAHSFYKAFHNIKDPNIDIPKEMMDLREDRELVVMMRLLPIWDFMSQLEGKASETIKFKKYGKEMLITANLGGKEMPIGGKEIPFESFEYDYLQGKTHIEFQVKDITGKVGRFRVYDSGFEEPYLTIKEGSGFDAIKDMVYDSKRDFLRIEYDHHTFKNCLTDFRFMEPPDEIDLVTRTIPEEMRIEWEKAVKSNNKIEMGKIGARVAAKIVEGEYNLKVPLNEEIHGPDGQITLYSEPGVFEAKSTGNISKLGKNLRDAEKQVKGRNKVGIAVSVYIEMATGFFEYIHKYVPGPSISLNRYEGGES